jgi:diguanylate cyclase (GGDEF)-like protein
MQIVLVDGSRVVLKIVTGLLNARGHTVHAFSDGQEALAFINSNAQIDTLITSAELPSISGVEMCWQACLLSSMRRPIYIIMMSSNGDRHKLAEALDSGADDFLGKPPVPEELYARLRAAERHAAAQRELFRLATTDYLTGVMNRRSFFETAQSIFAETSDETISAVMLDIDHFKRINDVHGHATGDEVIRAIACLATSVGDIVGRLGGEEFAILLTRASAARAADIAQRLRAAIAALAFDASPGPLKVTCSFGISERMGRESVDDLLRRADSALYQAKRSGRNRVVLASDDTPDPPPTASRLVRSASREAPRTARRADDAVA